MEGRDSFPDFRDYRGNKQFGDWLFSGELKIDKLGSLALLSNVEKG